MTKSKSIRFQTGSLTPDERDMNLFIAYAVRKSMTVKQWKAVEDAWKAMSTEMPPIGELADEQGFIALVQAQLGRE